MAKKANNNTKRKVETHRNPADIKDVLARHVKGYVTR